MIRSPRWSPTPAAWRPNESPIAWRACDPPPSPDETLRLNSPTCALAMTSMRHPTRRWADPRHRALRCGRGQRYRDEGRIDFGRGFMGFEVVRSVVDDLKARRIGWSAGASMARRTVAAPRGRAILRHLMAAITAGHVADRLVIETDGRFLTNSIAELAATPHRKPVILDGDRAPASVLDTAAALLSSHRHEDVAIWRVHTARDGFDVDALNDPSMHRAG